MCFSFFVSVQLSQSYVATGHTSTFISCGILSVLLSYYCYMWAWYVFTITVVQWSCWLLSVAAHWSIQ